MKKILALVLALVMIVCATACGSSSASTTAAPADGASANNAASPEKPSEATAEAPSGSKELVVACSESMVTLDPQNQTMINGMAALLMSNDPLVNNDHAGNYTPGLATEWTLADDGLTWSFKLREGVTFHNGEPFDADDVVCTFQRILDEGASLGVYSSWFQPLESVTKVDDFTVELKTSEPYPLFLDALGYAFIIPNEAFAEYGDDLWNQQMCYGTGPWVFDEWVADSYIRWTRNDNYWGGNDSVYDAVTMRFVKEASSAIAAQLSGDIDAYLPASGIPVEMLSLYAGYEDTINIVQFESTFFKYMGLQCGEGKPFADKKVREAFSLAIDRQLLIDQFIQGGSIPSSIVNSLCKGYDEALPLYEYNPEKAAEVLAESSYNGEEIVLLGQTNLYLPEETLLAMSEMLNAVGFNTTVEVVEFAVFKDMRAAGNYDCFMSDAVQTGGDPHAFINLRIYTDAHRSDYVNPELQEAIAKANVEMDPEVRNEYLKDVARIVREEYAPHLNIANMAVIFAINKDVTGLLYFPDAYIDLRYVGA